MEKHKRQGKSGPALGCIKGPEPCLQDGQGSAYWDIDKFIINDRSHYERILELVDIALPAKRRVGFCEDENIFEYYQLDSKLARASSRKVWLMRRLPVSTGRKPLP